MAETHAQFYTITKDAWTAMLDEIKAAKRTIDIEQYIFIVDSVGRQFVEVLREKARLGVRVRILCDMVGSYSFYRSLLPELLSNVGIEVRFFNPVSPWRIVNFTSNFFRDHRKILVVDGEAAHVGGVGVQEHMADWRDTHMRLTGPIVPMIADTFETIWNGVDKGLFVRFRKQLGFVRNYDLLTNAPSFGQRNIYHALIYRIRNAKKYVYLTSPYFIPDIPFYRAMRLAAKRGVDVRLLVPVVADHLFVNHARESYFTLALKAGIRIYRYQPVMMHAKTAVVDDEWATAGSFNLDSLSFYFNHEANVGSTDKPFIDDVRRHFLEDIQKSEEVTHDEWIKRPWRKKFLELLTWPFHGFM